MSDSLVTPRPQTAKSGDPALYQHSDSPATRHLCAGAYLERSFRDLVICKVHNDPRRRVAPSYGFDLVPVVRHAWYSWFLEVGQQAAIVACLLTGLVLGANLEVVIVTCALLVWLMARVAAGLTLTVIRLRTIEMTEEWPERRVPRRRGTRRRRAVPVRLLRTRMRQLKAALAGVATFLVLPIVAAEALDGSLGEAVPTALVIAGVLVVCAATVGVLRQLQLNGLYRAGSLRPTTLTRREEAVDAQQTHSCVVYRRPERKDDLGLLDFPTSDDDPSPFVGSGELVHRWLPPLTVQLLHPGSEGMEQREHVIPPFTASELVERLRVALGQLGEDAGAETLRGLRVRDRVYVAEEDVSSDRRLLRDNLDQPALRSIIDDHQSTAHHFLETSVPISGGELVTTVLLRVSVKGRCLSLDVATCALTRTPREYQAIGAFAEHGPGAVLRSALRSIFDLPVEVRHLWRLACAPAVLLGAWWAVKDRTLVPRRGVKVGARVAVRAEKADAWEDAQLDMTTIYDHMKIIEQRILRAAEDFLDAYDVDTSVFRRQATNIINSGVLNMGGKTEVTQSAVGANAQFSQNSAGRAEPEGARA